MASSRYRSSSHPVGYTEDVTQEAYTVRRRPKAAPFKGTPKETDKAPAPSHPDHDAPPAHDQVIDLLADRVHGMLASEIAQQLGITEDQVHKILQEHQRYGSVYPEDVSGESPRWYLG